MAPPVSFIKKTLDYPIYTAAFDPYNRGYLVVGGGGGEGRSGVSNTITLLDISSRSTIETTTELKLSRDEDSVMCLANLASGNGLITYAGINSSEAEQKKGDNEHFRSFRIEYPTKGKKDREKFQESREMTPRRATRNAKNEEDQVLGSVQPLNRASLFEDDTRDAPETYQRLLRLSPPQLREGGSRRLGAIATGLAQESEIIIFKATSSIPDPDQGDIIQRITPPGGAEAGDMDIADVDTFGSTSPSFAFAYCDTYNIYLAHITPSFSPKAPAYRAKDPRRIFAVPTSGMRAKFRSLRFLGSNHIIALMNNAKTKPAELVIFRLPDSPDSEEAQEVRRLVLPAHMKSGVGLDVVALDADPKTGARQFVAAVAGQDTSVAIYSIEYSGSVMGKPKKYAKFQDVHPGPITSVVFSYFHRPDRATSARNVSQYLRLVTTSVANSLTIDTLPLDTRSTGNRYFLRGGTSSMVTTGATFFTMAFVLLISLLIAQNYLDLKADQSDSPRTAIIPQAMRDLVPDNVKSLLAEMKVPGDRSDHVTQRKVKYFEPKPSADPDAYTVTHTTDDGTIRTKVVTATESATSVSVVAEEPTPAPPAAEPTPEAAEGGGAKKAKYFQPKPHSDEEMAYTVTVDGTEDMHGGVPTVVVTRTETELDEETAYETVTVQDTTGPTVKRVEYVTETVDAEASGHGEL